MKKFISTMAAMFRVGPAGGPKENPPNFQTRPSPSVARSKTAWQWLARAASGRQKTTSGRWGLLAVPVLLGFVFGANLELGKPAIPEEFFVLETSQAMPGKLAALEPFGLPGPEALAPDARDAVAEAVAWMGLLAACDDELLSSYAKALKYNSLTTAAILVSSAALQKNEQQKWSSLAVDFSHRASVALESQPIGDQELEDELRTRCLIAMALNYYQAGGVQEKDLVSQYQQISMEFLFRKGFCKHKILTTLASDGIIHLPGFGSEKYI